jgi:hypothetical protein
VRSHSAMRSRVLRASPCPVEVHQVLIGHPTALSDVDGHPVVDQRGKQVTKVRQATPWTSSRLARRTTPPVAHQDHRDVMADRQRTVGREVQRQRRAHRIVGAPGEEVQDTRAATSGATPRGRMRDATSQALLPVRANVGRYPSRRPRASREIGGHGRRLPSPLPPVHQAGSSAPADRRTVGTHHPGAPDASPGRLAPVGVRGYGCRGPSRRRPGEPGAPG